MRVLAQDHDHEVEATVTKEGTQITVKIGEDEHQFTLESDHNGRMELRHANGTLHIVELDGTDLRVDGRAHPMSVRKAPPQVAGAMGGAGGAGGVTKVKPPMPGKIAKLAVANGDHVQPGDVLVILEAMKMQNEIVSPIEGTVKNIQVAEGESIDAKRVICEIE